MSSSLRRSASTRDADVEGGAVYDDDIDWTKVKRTQKGKAPPLTLLGAGVCAAWLCLTTTRTVGRYEAFVACCVAYGALFSTYLRKWIAKRSGGDSAMRAISTAWMLLPCESSPPSVATQRASADGSCSTTG